MWKFLLALVPVLLYSADNLQPVRWTQEAANAWYTRQPWLVGSNYLPSDAINELEMWQADSFDPKRIDKELGWAEDIGMNTMRVFLRRISFGRRIRRVSRRRIDTFLTIAVAASHSAFVRFVRFLLGPGSAPGQTARTHTGRS